MDQDILNILKNLTEKMHCPGCGKNYSLTEVKFMSQQKEQYLLQLACEKCKMPVWVNVLNGKLGELQKENAILDFDEILTDEIIDFHQELKTFDGNFKKIFSK